MWRLRGVFFVVGLAVFATMSGGLYYLARQPLPSPKPLKQTTFIYGSNGQVLATFSEQNRVDVTLKQVPQVVIDAVVSTEDRHFFTEGALDPAGIIRAVISDLRGSGNLQGASTITQQYVKQTYLNSQRSLSRKIKEAALAIRLARSESKKQILQNYLNTIYWGRGAYGVQAASHAYFGLDVSKLGLAQASLLAALIKEPQTADPASDPKAARAFQDETLRAMERDGKITGAEAARVEATSFSKYVISPTASTGVITPVAGDQYFISAVRQELYSKFPRELVDGGGLRVTTTLDPTLQNEAYNAIYGKNNADSLNPAGGEPSGALVSMNDSGEVKALVGGQDYSKSTVDLALGTAGGGSGRQAGSTFKAFMLADVIKNGYSVESTFQAPKQIIIPHGNSNGTNWNVSNFEDESVPGQVSLVQATADSINTVYAQVVTELGASALDSMAEQMGISPSELPGAYPSQVLGTADVSPLEMSAAYATLADGGVYHAPILITKVTTASGKALPLPVRPTSREVLTPDQAALESYVLQQVVLDGTGGAAGGVGTPVAGKTGTTDKSTDAWFIGYTPNLTTAVWMGYANSERSMDGFRGIPRLTGGTVPATLWHDYMAAALASEPQYMGTFPMVYSFGSQTLGPPAAGTVVIPTTTTLPPPTTTTVPKSATTRPGSSTSVTPTTTSGSPTTVHSPPTTAKG